MDKPILVSRRELLRDTQNADGGWGYFRGKQSWLEPTAYAMLALHGDPASAAAVERAWKLVRSWQHDDGGWKPAAHINGSTWVTALGVTLCTVQEEYGRTFETGVKWLLRTTGAESGLLSRVMHRILGKYSGSRDTSNRGWPWREGSSAWVEPTAQSLIALKKASPHYHDRELRARIREGEQLLLTVRSRDGGWNYGSPSALGIDLPSYPETTALALLGLQKGVPTDYRLPQVPTHSRMADAWLAVTAGVLGQKRAADTLPDPPADLMVAALEALAAPGGNHPLLRAEEA